MESCVAWLRSWFASPKGAPAFEVAEPRSASLRWKENHRLRVAAAAAMLIEILKTVLSALRSAFRSRAALLAENVVLRQQLIVLRRSVAKVQVESSAAKVSGRSSMAAATVPGGQAPFPSPTHIWENALGLEAPRWPMLNLTGGRLRKTFLVQQGANWTTVPL